MHMIERLAEHGWKPHRDCLAQKSHGPQVTDICVKNTGMRFHRIRDFKKNCFSSIPPTSQWYQTHELEHNINKYIVANMQRIHHKGTISYVIVRHTLLINWGLCVIVIVLEFISVRFERTNTTREGSIRSGSWHENTYRVHFHLGSFLIALISKYSPN